MRIGAATHSKAFAHKLQRLQKKGKLLEKSVTHLKDSNDLAKVKKLFSELGQHDHDLASIYYSLKSDSKIKSEFEKLYIAHTVQSAVAKSAPELLTDPLAKTCGIDIATKEQLVDALKQQNSPKSLRIAKEITSISKLPYSCHRMQPVEMLGVCIGAELALERVANTTNALYARANELRASRSCVLDPKRRTFTILSKSNGSLDAEGAFKRVSDAIEVRILGDNAQARRVAHVRNKADETIRSSELDYEMRYGDIITSLHYQAKNRPYETKTLLIQELYDHDLYIFTEFTPEDERKKITLDEMIQVLEPVGKTLLKMHNDNIIHRDVKAKNILYRKNKEGKVEAKLIDFGHCYTPNKENYPAKRKKGYGTLRYSAPDLLEHPRMKGDPLFLAKAEDAYALGECIYEVYLQQATPWGSLSYRALKKKKNAEENRAEAIRLQKKEAQLLADMAGPNPKTAEKELIRIMSRLLEPDPKKRMQIAEFMDALYALKAKYATVNAV